MLDNNDLSPQAIKNKQYRTLVIVLIVIITAIIGISYVMQANAPRKEKKTKMESVSFSSSIDHVDAQSVWLEKAQNQLKYQQKQIDELKANKQEQVKTSSDAKQLEEDQKYADLKKKNEFLEKSLLQKEDNQNLPMQGSSAYNGKVFSTAPGVQTTSTNIPNHVIDEAQNPGIESDELKLKPVSNHLPKKNPDTYVPAGTFAEAVMLGAADASAGVTSQANPSPMLFHIISDGTLPNHHKSHLKDCFVTAAVVGDISSERGEIRLERISCTFPNGEIVEQQVEGTVFGMDAKNGVRGIAYWGDGKLLFRAGAAGFAGGIGNGISQSFSTNQISPLGVTSTVPGADILKNGLATGASNGLEKLSDYSIKQADQFHPVIQITAGQTVDIVILKGYFLDGKKHEEDINTAHTEPELFPSETAQTETGLTLSEQQLQKIKQHEEAMGWVNNKKSGENI